MFETPEEVVETPDTEAEPEVEAEVETEDEQPPVEAKPVSRSDARKEQLNAEIRELVARKKAIETQMRAMQQPPVPEGPEGWDKATVDGVRQIVRNDPMARQLQAQLLEIKIRNANPDYDEHFDDMASTFQELAQEGFGGEKTAQLVLDAIRARKGVYTAQGAKQAQQKQSERAAASTPTGGAPSRSEKSPLEAVFDGSNKNRAAREAYREQVKRGMI